jgi:hypothetical protein
MEWEPLYKFGRLAAKPEYLAAVRKILTTEPQSLMQIVKSASKIAQISKTQTLCAMDAMHDELVVETIDKKKVYSLKK